MPCLRQARIGGDHAALRCTEFVEESISYVSFLTKLSGVKMYRGHRSLIMNLGKRKSAYEMKVAAPAHGLLTDTEEEFLKN